MEAPIKFLYWITTLGLCAIMLYSASLYFLETDKIKGFFSSFNYPEYLVIPLAIVKILGLSIILWRPKRWLTEWAYAGFFFNLVLASTAHTIAHHGIGLSFYAMPILLVSYVLGKKVRM